MRCPSVSIIIPTYNRLARLRLCLAAIEAQTFPMQQIEVIVIDDGSTDETRLLLAEKRDFRLQVITQQNQGQVAALNNGAQSSRAELLVFLDDDAIVPSDFVTCVVETHRLYERAIVIPEVQSACTDPGNHYANAVIREQIEKSAEHNNSTKPRLGHFTDLIGCCFTVKRSHFFEIGPMQTLPKKLWPDWNDVDFAYRALQQNFDFWVCPSLTVHHYESAVASLESAGKRAYNSGRSATRLFKRHPDLFGHLPMFRDKGPIAWKEDLPGLILRKFARQAVSSGPVMWMMESAVPLLERHAPKSTALRLLYRWIISGYIYRGYRVGLRELAC